MVSKTEEWITALGTDHQDSGNLGEGGSEGLVAGVWEELLESSSVPHCQIALKNTLCPSQDPICCTFTTCLLGVSCSVLPVLPCTVAPGDRINRLFLHILEDNYHAIFSGLQNSVPKVYNINLQLFESPFHPFPCLPEWKTYCFSTHKGEQIPWGLPLPSFEIQGRKHLDWALEWGAKSKLRKTHLLFVRFWQLQIRK